MTSNCTVLITVGFYPWNKTPWECDAAVEVLCPCLCWEEWPWSRLCKGWSLLHVRSGCGTTSVRWDQEGFMSTGRAQGCSMQALPEIAIWEFDMHCFFCWWKENDLSSYLRCIFHIFPSLRHLYHTQLSPLALLVITCLLLSAVVILGGFLLVFWVVCFLLNHSNPTKLLCLCSFHIHSSMGCFWGLFFFECSIKSRNLCVTLPVRNFVFFYFCTQFGGTLSYVHFKNNIIWLKPEIITEYICCPVPGLLQIEHGAVFQCSVSLAVQDSTVLQTKLRDLIRIQGIHLKAVLYLWFKAPFFSDSYRSC